jgi:hypothetical protein
MKVLLYVDDLIVRGSPEESSKFHDSLETRFDCREGSRQLLTPEHPIDFTGVTITMEKGQNLDSYYLDQKQALASFFIAHDLDDCPVKDCPMPDATVLTRSPELVGSELSSWCKSINGALHHFARSTRWDISHAVSRLSQVNRNPTVGMVDSIKYLAGYLKNSLDYKLGGPRLITADCIQSFTDSDFHGDKAFTSQSQTGIIILLNGIPCHWRSNRQPSSVGSSQADSPACAEIYALKEGVKDSRLFHWVAAEIGVSTHYPFVVQVDSKQAKSFNESTCPKSAIRGSFDWREDWVDEVRDLGVVKTEYISSSSNLADLLTKCLSRPKFSRLFSLISECAVWAVHEDN